MRRMLLAIPCLAVWFASPGVCQTFVPGPDMTEPRYYHSAVRLADGKVLLAGGYNNARLDAAETADLYDPATNSITQTGSMVLRRYAHTATLLKDGRVLVTGGRHLGLINVSSTEIYDPATGSFSPGADMLVQRQAHTAVLLKDGRVLLVGTGVCPPCWDQTGSRDPLPDAEIFDPATGGIEKVGDMLTARDAMAAALLPDGRVLVTGGAVALPNGYFAPSLSTTEIFDPETQSFTAGPNMLHARRAHKAITLEDGRVVLVGGVADVSTFEVSAEVLDPVTMTFSPLPSLAVGRSEFTSTLLGDGTVLTSGGGTEAGVLLRSTEFLDASRGRVASGPAMVTDRYAHTTTLLENGEVLVAGGLSQGAGFTQVRTTEIGRSLEIISVRIDIRPDIYPNTINLRSGGGTPVGIYSSSTFDAATIDPLTVTLASAPVRLKGKGTPAVTLKDLDGDGLIDMLAHVDSSALALRDVDMEAVLEAKTIDGRRIRGADTVRVLE